MIRVQSIPGVSEYEAVRKLQLALVEKRARDEIPDTLLFLEHKPVITRGRGLQFTGTPRPRHMPIPAHLPADVSFVEAERGGDLTYHGPGQLVIYPIFKLDGRGFGPKRDVGGFLRKIEDVVIDELESHGIFAQRREGATGVWVGDRKVASIGIAVRKWVTYHGIAINCVNDLSPFRLISPCGFAPEVMTRVLDHLPESQREEWSRNWRQDLEEGLASRIVLSFSSGSTQPAQKVHEFRSGGRIVLESS